MDCIRREIFDAIEDNDLDFKKVAKQIGVTPRSLEYFRSGERNIGFRYLLKMSYVVCPDNQQQKMSEWCPRLNTPELIKNSFEYASVTRNVDLLKQLLEVHQVSHGVVKECVDIYSFIFQYMSNQIKHPELLHNILAIKSVKDSAMQVLVEIYKCVGLFQQRRLLALPDYIFDIEQKIKAMSDKRELFLKECFLHRLSEISAHTHLHLNNLTRARHYAKILINGNINNKTKSDGLLVLGMSYLNENAEKCINYLVKSHETMQKTNIDFLIEFTLYNLHYAQLLLEVKLPADADPALVMFEKYKTNEVSKESAKEAIAESGDTDLIALFDGISSDECTKLYEKYHEFVSDANLFNAAIVVNEMLKRGENSDFVQSLTKLKLNNFKKGDVLFEENFISSFSNDNIISSVNCA